LVHIQQLDLESQKELNFFEFDNSGNLVGFAERGRRMMRFIANHLRYLHSESKFCSNLHDSVFIQLPSLSAYFPFVPCNPDSRNDLISGIANDSLQFRYIVSLLMKATPQLINLNQPLPIDFQFFFSSVFTRGLLSDRLEVVKEHSFYQLYHPATFNDADRSIFIHKIGEYRFKDMNRFDTNLNLDKPEYNLADWQNVFPPQHFLAGMIRHSVATNYGRSQTIRAGAIPRFIRNAHQHFDSPRRGQLHGQVFVF